MGKIIFISHGNRLARPITDAHPNKLTNGRSLKILVNHYGGVCIEHEAETSCSAGVRTVCCSFTHLWADGAATRCREVEILESLYSLLLPVLPVSH